MKRLSPVACAMLLVACAGAAFPRSVRTRAQVSAINHAVVALVADSVRTPGMLRAYCSGAFVDRYLVLTAAHCVRGVGAGETVGVVTWAGYKASGEILSGTNVTAFEVHRVDPPSDLALLIAVGPGLEPHGMLRVAERTPRQGEFVLLAGHPFGIPFSISHGIVGAARRTAWPEQPEGADVLFVQHTAPASPGNSGGPLLDADDRLAGVLVQGVPGAAHLSMSVHLSVVRRFLGR